MAGKTGTTENYGDAWFVGFDTHYTVAVWVGYPDKLIPMKTLFAGQPVEGGTYPAQIWHDFMVQALNILNTRNPKKNKLHFTPGTTGGSSPATAPSGTSGAERHGRQGGQQQNQGKSSRTSSRPEAATTTGRRRRRPADAASAADPPPGNGTGGAGSGGARDRHRYAHGERDAGTAGQG